MICIEKREYHLHPAAVYIDDAAQELFVVQGPRNYFTCIKGRVALFIIL